MPSSERELGKRLEALRKGQQKRAEQKEKRKRKREADLAEGLRTKLPVA